MPVDLTGGPEPIWRPATSAGEGPLETLSHGGTRRQPAADGSPDASETEPTAGTGSTVEVAAGDPTVTVIVCTYRGGRDTLTTLEMLRGQTVADRMRILVVDDGSGDRTAQLCRDAGYDVVEHEVNKGLAAARNTGLAAAGTDLVAFTDDDCEPEPTWIEDLLAARERHPDAVAWGGAAPAVETTGFLGRYHLETDPLSPLERDLAAGDSLLYRFGRYLRRAAAPAPTGERDVFSLAGANMMLDRRTVLRQGGFDERFRFGGEEEDLFRRLSLAGERVVFTPAARVGHRFENTVADLLRRSRAYGRGNARMRAKHPEITPTVYPAPVLVTGLLALAAAASGPSRAVALAGAVAVPNLLFSRWLRQAVAERSPALLAYPYLQLLQEAASDLGWMDYYRHEHRRFTRS